MYKFKAIMVKDDERTGYKKGRTWNPKGFYYQGKKVILVGNVDENHTTRLVFPIENVRVDIK